MIEYIKGALAELKPTYAVVETAAGAAYRLEISMIAFEQLQGREQVKLLAHEVIREDAWTLFGFADERERELFRLLIGVSGVGANSARLILSAIPASELAGVIASGNIARLKGVKGIGSKTAQRIIVDLKDKINTTEDTLISQDPSAQNAVMDEALAALTMLGFQRAAAQKALDKIFAATPGIKVEQAIKQALAMM